MKTIELTRDSGRRRAAFVALACLAALALSPGSESAPAGEETQPNILILTVDTLRADRLSGQGYERATSPQLDRLMGRGVQFSSARTVEPLTAPSLASMLTALYPHEHGASRNGLRMRSGLPSMPKALQAFGYRTAAFVGNWTLRDKLSGLAEHFEHYEPVLTRKRWLGLVRSEATAWDVNSRALDWLEEHQRRHGERPFFLWLHYTEPHAPYRAHKEFFEQLGLQKGKLSAADRYDTEIAFVDAAIGEMLREFGEQFDLDETVVVFAADHGESLGEHDYWGHGRNLYEPTLRIPMSITWPARLQPRSIAAPSLIVDLPPTLLSLIGRPIPTEQKGFDWSGVIAGDEPPDNRITRYQAHRGAVISKHDSDLARRSGLLQVGVIRGDEKEIFRIENSRRRFFNLGDDPLELNRLGSKTDPPSEGLQNWMRIVYSGLSAFDDQPPRALDEESIRQLRSLGYVD